MTINKHHGPVADCLKEILGIGEKFILLILRLSVTALSNETCASRKAKHVNDECAMLRGRFAFSNTLRHDHAPAIVQQVKYTLE